MLTLKATTGELGRGVAVTAGLLAGAATLGLIAAGWALLDLGGAQGDSAVRRLGQPIPANALLAGDCIDLDQADPTPIILVDCEMPHTAEVSGRIAVPNQDTSYPGNETLVVWARARCREANEDHLGVPLLSTSLEGANLVPTFDQWADGDTLVTCTLSRFGGGSLTGSVAGRGDEVQRGDRVPVSRLMVGDCFTPPPGVGSYDLNSASPVDLADCAGVYNGVLFGRGALDSGTADEPFPGDEAVSAETGERCAALFETTYGVPASGFNYRFWRPNTQSWSEGDRTVLCSVLDANPLTGPFEPESYQPFFDLDPGACFELGPEESASSLGLDDQVREVPCNRLHTGQMIGSGSLADDAVDLDPATADQYPGDEEVEGLAGAQCEVLFEAFIGISPYESELLRFPFWYPNDMGWAQGDRRFACAFLHQNRQIGSLEGARI